MITVQQDKIKDSISSLLDLDDFTDYILNPESKDALVELNDNSFITEKLIVTYPKQLSKEVEERILDIVNGEIVWVEEIPEIQKNEKTIVVQGVTFVTY